MTDPTHLLMTAARQQTDALVKLQVAQHDCMFTTAQYRAMRKIFINEVHLHDADHQETVFTALALVDRALADLEGTIRTSFQDTEG